MAGGAKLLREGVAERGKGVGTRRVGEGGGVRGGARGVESIFKWSFEQNRYRYFRLGCRNECYDTKSGGIPNFGGNPCCNDITFLKIHHNLARKWDCKRIQYCTIPGRSLVAILIFCSLKDFKFNLWSNGSIFSLNIWEMNTLWWYLDVFQARRL